MTQGRKKLFYLIGGVILLLIFFQWAGQLGFLKGKIVGLILPGQKVFYGWGLSLGNLFNYSKIAAENAILKEELAKLSVDYLKLSALQGENDYLRQELNFIRAGHYQSEVAAVVGQLPFNDQVLIIDKGSESGLTAGLPATFNQGILVGKIIQTETNRSLVELLTSAKSEVAATLSEAAGTNGLIKGAAGQGMILDLIPQDQEVKEGDKVMTSGLEEKMPRGLLIGQVGTVESRVGQVFKQARVVPPFDLRHSHILTVIKS